jgi:hypothetical protein
MSERLKEHDWKSCVRATTGTEGSNPSLSAKAKDDKIPGPAQREGCKPRQVRKEAAVAAIPCAAGRLVLINPEVITSPSGSKRFLYE